MNNLLSYLLQVIVASGILYAYYHFALRNKRFHRYNRFYLLSAIIISITIPFLNIPVYFTSEEAHSSFVLQTLTTISPAYYSGTNFSDTVIVTATKENWFTWEHLIYGFYALIAALVFIRILISLRKIRMIIRKNPVEKLDHIRFVNTNEPGTPFSFFRWLFWDRKIELRSEKGEQVFRHELFHIEQKHSVDVMFTEILTMIFWINPFFHLMKKELKAIHEFLADQFAISENKKWEYAELLLMQALNTNVRLTNPFFHNQIKRRIAMITSSSKPGHQYLRKILVLPIAAIVLALFAFTYKEKAEKNVVRSEKPFTVVLDAGHGGNFPGVKSADNNYNEADLTLQLSKTIEKFAKDYNITVVMTRKDQNSPEGAKTLKDDLKNRMGIVNNVKPDAFISIHMNEAPIKHNLSGIEAYIAGKKEDNSSRILASAILQGLSDVYTTNPEIKQRIEKGVYLLDQNDYPSVLLECGYIDNPNDLAFISNKNSQEKTARAILSALVKYANNHADAGENISLITDTTKPKQPEIILENAKSLPPPAKKIPADELLKKWQDPNVYGIRLDEKKINNTELVKYKSTDFSNYYVSKLYGAAKKNVIYNYQVDLMTNKYYQKILTEWNSNKDLRASAFVFNDSLYRKDQTDSFLVVINGIMKGVSLKSDLDKIKPNDIKSITVLKGASAIAKYGEKAKNGVIEIFMKQNNDYNKTDTVPTNKNSDPDDGKIFEKMDIDPQFDGDWRRFLEKNLNGNIPSDNKAPAGTYTVVLQFIVDKNGNLSDVKALTKHGYGMEEEAIRVIKLSPNWKPGIQNSHIVKAYRKQPITFVIVGDKKNNSRSNKESLLSENSNISLNEVVVTGYGKTTGNDKTVTTPSSLNEVVVTGYSNPISKDPDVPASFPDGHDGWEKFLQKNCNASVPSDSGAAEGTYNVWVQFIVDENGNISSIKPTTSLGFGMEDELVRLISISPKWIPAMQNGRKVSSYVKQRLTFVIEEDDASFTSNIEQATKIPDKNSLYPNPSTNAVNIQLASKIPGNAQIKIFDLAGKVVFAQKKSLTKGLNSVSINTTLLNKGTYIIHVSNPDKSERNYKMIKQ